jgi:hypothetical protein
LSEVQHLRSLVRQATLYHAQGLFAESRAKYEEILSLLGSGHQFQNVEKLAQVVRQRLDNVELDRLTRDLRHKALERSHKADYSDLSDDCTSSMGYSWIRKGVSWTRTRITYLRSRGGLRGKKRLWS